MTDNGIHPAPHTTRLGQLQRGQGTGFCAAIEAGREAHDDLIRCVVDDPRIDSQLESRERYYAELFVALDAPIEPLVSHLVGRETALGHGVLAGAFCLGHAPTRALLANAKSDEAVVQGVARQLWNFSWARHVELKGRAAKAFLREALDVAQCAESSRRRQINSSLPGEMSIADLLELGRQMHKSQRWAVVEELCRRGSEEDRQALADTLEQDVVYDRVHLAACALGTLGDERPLPAVDDYFSREDVFDDPTRRLAGFDRMRRAALVDYVLHLPMDRQLELARAWHARGGYFETIAGKIFGAKATPDDRTRIEAFIEEQTAGGTGWEIIDELVALGRIGDTRSAPLLVQVAEQATHSQARSRALHALCAMQQLPDAARVVHESLWDCEDEAAGSACALLSEFDPQSRARVTTLSSLALADEALRSRAVQRLR